MPWDAELSAERILNVPLLGLLVVGVALVDAGVPLGGRVDLHLGLDPVLAPPVLADLHQPSAVQATALMITHM